MEGAGDSFKHFDYEKNLMGPSKVLKEAWHKLTSVIEKDMFSKRIMWHHNPPKASHFGGLFEPEVT